VIGAADILAGRILIVDDQAANVLLLERTLQGAGYTSIASTTDPRQVCALHTANRYDLILLDLQMPGMDGFLVMEALRAIEVDGILPILVVSARRESNLRALMAGAKDFVAKPFDLTEVLIRVRNLLEVRLLQRETKRLYDCVVAEQKLSERLLLNVLPVSIARRLKGRVEAMGEAFSAVIADRYQEVSVLFADIVEFTKFSRGVSAEVLVDILNDIFTRFDAIADAHGMEKIKTIGDAYMAAAGLPLPLADHAQRAAHMAFDMMEALDRFNAHHHHKLAVRIGIDSGAVVAGVIGKRKFVFDLWGEVVNTASRMESHGLPGRIQVTDTTRERLGEAFRFEDRGTIAVKGAELMHTWFLAGRAPLPQSAPRRLAGSPR
jgi:adenylate cyclase